MALAKNETLIGMSILPASVASVMESEGGSQESEEEDSSGRSGSSTTATPSVLLVTAQGLGKRVPVAAFKLQHRAGKGNIAIKCNPGDRLVALHVV
jgi:DNA gyrase subunit A